MADIKVSDLPSISVADNNDVLYIVDTSENSSKQITYGNALSGVNSNIVSLSSSVSDFTSVVLELSSKFETGILDISDLATDVPIVSSNVDELSANQIVLGDDVDVVYTSLSGLTGLFDQGLTTDVSIGGTTLTFLSGLLINVT